MLGIDEVAKLVATIEDNPNDNEKIRNIYKEIEENINIILKKLPVESL